MNIGIPLLDWWMWSSIDRLKTFRYNGVAHEWMILRCVVSMMDEILEKLEESVARLSEINRAIDESMIIAITDVTGKITFVNKKFCEISKYSAEELLGQNHRIINSGYHPKSFFREMWRTIAQGHIWQGEIRNRTKDGQFYWVDTTIVPCLNESNKPYQYISFRVDISERKKFEEHIKRMEQLEIAAQISSSLAHEVRNPLAAIQWSLLSLPDIQPSQQMILKSVEDELKRMDNILGDFLSLSKPSTKVKYPLFLQEILQKALDLQSQFLQKRNIQVIQKIDKTLPRVNSEENQLKQVIHNLLKNAIEAMPDGGKLEIIVDTKVCKNDNFFVCLTMKDTGIGMNQEQLTKIRQPFFTTKPNGTGLGLMVCERIIQEQGGNIEISSIEGKGTTVTVCLPAL